MGLYVVAVEEDEELVPELRTLGLLGRGLVGLAGYASLRYGRKRNADPRGLELAVGE